MNFDSDLQQQFEECQTLADLTVAVTAIKLSPVAPISVTPHTLGVTDEPGYIHDRNHPSPAR